MTHYANPIIISEGSKALVEKNIRQELHSHLGGVEEDGVQHGRVDLSLQQKIIEVKDVKQWKQGIGQLIIYGLEEKNVGKKQCLHLFGYLSEQKRKFIQTRCDYLRIEVEFRAPIKEEPLDEQTKSKKRTRQFFKEYEERPTKRQRSTKQQLEQLNNQKALIIAKELEQVELISLEKFNQLKSVGISNQQEELMILKFDIYMTYGILPSKQNVGDAICMDVDFLTEFGSRDKQKQFLQFDQWTRADGKFDKNELQKLHREMDILAPDSFLCMVDIVDKMMEAADIEVGRDFLFKKGQLLTPKMQSFWDQYKNSWAKHLGSESATTAKKMSAPVYVRIFMDLLTHLFGSILSRLAHKNGQRTHRFVWNLDSYLKLVKSRRNLYGFSYPLKPWAIKER